METTAPQGLVSALRHAHLALCSVVERVDSMADLAADELIEATELAGAISRLSDVVAVCAVGSVEDQCRRAMPDESLAARHGMRDAAALLMTITGVSRRTLARWRQSHAVTAPRGFGSTGVLPPLLPHLAEAFRGGLISVDQAMVIREHLMQAGPRAHPEAAEAAERALVASATGACPGEDGCDSESRACRHRESPLAPELLAVQAKAWREALDPDGPESTYETQRAARSFTLGRRSDGMWVGKMLLPPDQGVALRLALDAHNAPRTAPRHEAAAGCPVAAAGPTDAGEIAGPASATTTPDSPEGPATWALEDARGAGLNRHGRADDRTTQQRQADTLLGLLSRAMQLRDAPHIGGESATVVVTITDEQLTEHATTGGGTAHLEHTGETVPAHLAARIMCDGYLQACVLGADGLPLKLGRSRRTHTTHQRRAILSAYPGGCQNPGCDAPPGFTEIHHPIWWSEGGLTDTDDGIPLCQHCHTLVHTRHLRCVREAGERWRVAPSLPLRPRLSTRHNDARALPA